MIMRVVHSSIHNNFLLWEAFTLHLKPIRCFAIMEIITKISNISHTMLSDNNSDETLLLPLEFDNNQYQLLNLRFNKRLPT